MKTIFLTTALFLLAVLSPIKEPPNRVLKAFKQKFPSALNIIWTEEDNKINVTSNDNGKISEYVQDDANTWTADFILGDRKTSATFDLGGQLLNSQQEIKLEDIGVEEVRSAIKKDYSDCEILSIIIHNSPTTGTWYDVKAKCKYGTSESSYDYIGLPWPPKM